MLVVSNVSLTADLLSMKPETFLKATVKDSVLNINNDYRYMKTGYYVSVHAEILGDEVIPSSMNAIEVNRTPILLLRASKAGIPTLPFIVTSSLKRIMSDIAFPMIVFAVNPFSHEGYLTATNRSSLYRAVKSLSMHYKFAVCAQPLKGEMVSVKSIFGRTEGEPRMGFVARKVYETFGIPVCKLHIQLVGEEPFLCGLQGLTKGEISSQDLKVLSEEALSLSRFGEISVD